MQPEKIPRKRASKFIKDLVAPARQPSRDRVLWATRIVLVLVVLLAILTFIGLPFGITLWAWVKLLIVPAVLAIGGYLFNSAQSRATQAAAERHAQDEALQAYLDQMSQLLTDKELPLHSAQLGDSLSTVARARTLTVLGRLDSGRKRSVLQFLYESRLIVQEQALLDESDLLDRRHNIISLQQANLRGADLIGANLNGADLTGADLSGAELYGTNLSRAILGEAKGITNEKLEQQTNSLKVKGAKETSFLEGAILPNGQKYEEWLKDKESRGGD